MLPLFAGAAKTTLSVESDVETDEIVGAPGGTPGIAATALLFVPPPFTFTARRTTEYDEPLASPVITRGLVTAAGERVIQVVPPFNEYW